MMSQLRTSQRNFYSDHFNDECNVVYMPIWASLYIAPCPILTTPACQWLMLPTPLVITPCLSMIDAAHSIGTPCLSQNCARSIEASLTQRNMAPDYQASSQTIQQRSTLSSYRSPGSVQPFYRWTCFEHFSGQHNMFLNKME